MKIHEAEGSYLGRTIGKCWIRANIGLGSFFNNPMHLH